MTKAEHGSVPGPLDLLEDGTPASPGATRGKAASGMRTALAILALAGALVAVYVTPLRGALSEVGRLSSWLRGLGWVAPAIFVPAATGLIAVGCPRLLLCPIAGMAFGFLPGLLWAQVSALLGSYATFLFVRWSGREYVLGRWPRLRRYSHVIAGSGSFSVLLIRQIPLSGIWINALLGLSHVRHRDFLVGTAIGTLPEAVPVTLLGAGITQMSFGKGIAYVLAAAIWFVVAWQLVRWLRRSARGAVAVGDEGELGAQP